jgi:hypothetical protein
LIPVDQRRDRSSGDVVYAAADQRKRLVVKSATGGA